MSKDKIYFLVKELGKRTYAKSNNEALEKLSPSLSIGEALVSYDEDLNKWDYITNYEED